MKGINYFMYLIFLLIASAPVVYLLSKKWRIPYLIFLIVCLISSAFYILSGAELGSVTLGIETTLAPFKLIEHEYSRIAVFGFSFVGALALLYGLETAKPSEQAVSLCAIASAIGIGFSGDFITLFIFWELLTFTTGGLILLNGTLKSLDMGFRFLFFHVAGGLLIFLGILLQYSAVESFILMIPEAGIPFFVLGVGFKAAFLPLHLWVAWGYPAASLASSVVLAGLTTKVGIYAIARLLPPHYFFSIMGGSMALFGICGALLQKDLRKLLSYHIISQVGYMVAAVGLGHSLAVDGGTLHLVNHMLYKALLFMSAGAVLISTGTENAHDLCHGHHDENTTLVSVWKALPIATVGAVVGALSIAGIPPFNGYVSKYLLKNAVYGIEPAETMLLIASVGTTISFCKFVYFGFVKAKAPSFKKVPITMNIGILLVSACCIAFGVAPQLVASLIPYGSSLAVYSTSGIIPALQIMVLGMFVFVMIRGTLEKGIKPPPWLSIEYLVFAPLAKATYKALCRAGSGLDTSVDTAYYRLGGSFLTFCRMISHVDSDLDEFYERSSKGAYKLVERSKFVDDSINEAYDRSSQGAYRMIDKSKVLDDSINDAYNQSGKAAQGFYKGASKVDEAINDAYDQSENRAKDFVAAGQNRQHSGKKVSKRYRLNPLEWNIKNLNFDSLLLAIMLGLVFFVLFFFGRAV